MDLQAYRQRDSELERIRKLMDIIPHDRASVLDIGARDGYVTRLLSKYYGVTIALDLQQIPASMDEFYRCVCNVTCLAFKDGAVDTIVCTEVLEHIQPDHLRATCQEMIRVAKRDLIIGVPYRQDIRVGKTTCRNCRQINPPWGHVNRFDEGLLKDLFHPLVITKVQLVGQTRERISAIASRLMDLAGNPWGYYGFGDRCQKCGQEIDQPLRRSFSQKVLTKMAHLINASHRPFIRPCPEWIHVHFQKDSLSDPYEHAHLHSYQTRNFVKET